MHPSEPDTGNADSPACHVEGEKSKGKASSEYTDLQVCGYLSDLDLLMDLSVLTAEKNDVAQKTVTGILHQLPVALMIIENNGKIRYVDQKS
ncbi:MAG: hypothetical protein KK926_03505 [Methanomethylovorans sp.]|nr:hypothetical protein [Methanomethylovorans sp.]